MFDPTPSPGSLLWVLGGIVADGTGADGERVVSIELFSVADQYTVTLPASSVVFDSTGTFAAMFRAVADDNFRPRGTDEEYAVVTRIDGQPTRLFVTGKHLVGDDDLELAATLAAVGGSTDDAMAVAELACAHVALERCAGRVAARARLAVAASRIESAIEAAFTF